MNSGPSKDQRELTAKSVIDILNATACVVLTIKGSPVNREAVFLKASAMHPKMFVCFDCFCGYTFYTET